MNESNVIAKDKPPSEDLVSLVKKYQASESLDERKVVGEILMRAVGPELKAFILSEIGYRVGTVENSEDIHQSTLMAIAVGLSKFRGASNKSFWAWCYAIARNKLADSLKRLADERAEPMDMETLQAAIDASTIAREISAPESADLAYAISLLHQTKAPCFHFIWNRYIWGWDHTEIGKAFGMTKDGARMRIERCLDSVRLMMNRKGTNLYA